MLNCPPPRPHVNSDCTSAGHFMSKISTDDPGRCRTLPVKLGVQLSYGHFSSSPCSNRRAATPARSGHHRYRRSTPKHHNAGTRLLWSGQPACHSRRRGCRGGAAAEMGVGAEGAKDAGSDSLSGSASGRCPSGRSSGRNLFKCLPDLGSQSSSCERLPQKAEMRNWRIVVLENQPTDVPRDENDGEVWVSVDQQLSQIKTVHRRHGDIRN